MRAVCPQQWWRKGYRCGRRGILARISRTGTDYGSGLTHWSPGLRWKPSTVQYILV